MEPPSRRPCGFPMAMWIVRCASSSRPKRTIRKRSVSGSSREMLVGSLLTETRTLLSRLPSDRERVHAPSGQRAASTSSILTLARSLTSRRAHCDTFVGGAAGAPKSSAGSFSKGLGCVVRCPCQGNCSYRIECCIKCGSTQQSGVRNMSRDGMWKLLVFF